MSEAVRLDQRVTFAVGVFDLLTYTVPGSLYLGFFWYLAVRLNWLDPAVLAGTPSLLVVIITVLISYLLGYLAYPIGAQAVRVVPHRRKRDYRQEFLRRNPAARGRPFVAADPFLLVSALQLHDKDVAVEATRSRAAGLMLRNSAPPVALGAVDAIVELILGRVPAVAVAVLLGAGSVALIIQARRFSHWANIKTLELCFWLPDIDEPFNATPAPGQ